MVVDTDIALVLLGIVARQIDRWWFSDSRNGVLRISPRVRAATIRALVAKQRQRRNDFTPVVVVAGHWAEIVGYWLLCARPGILPAVLGCAALAVKARHLQEVSHFGVHGSLCRSRRLGDLLTELAAHAPLALSTVDSRRTSHVRLHHPNASAPRVDPNLAELARAGLRPGCGRWRFMCAMVFPLTPAGLARTCGSILANTSIGRSHWWRPALVVSLGTAAYACGGWSGLLALAIARAVGYPQLAWASLLVEHSWFRGRPRRGRPREVEARRCVRVYPGRRALALLARGTWLPYGDIFHFAHSVHPTIRWNYLPAVERLIGLPDLVPAGVVFGAQSAVVTLYRATRPADASRLADLGHEPTSDVVRDRAGRPLASPPQLTGAR